MQPDAPWGQEIQPGSLKTISDSKLVTFAVGTQKKSRFQKAREEKEQKRRQEEVEAAKVFEDFVASFEDPDAGVKTFVRSKLESAPPVTASAPQTEREKLLEEMKVWKFHVSSIVMSAFRAETRRGRVA